MKPGVAKDVTHVINTGVEKPINQMPYRVEPKERKAIGQQCQRRMDVYVFALVQEAEQDNRARCVSVAAY
jgi:hypothetical protein